MTREKCPNCGVVLDITDDVIECPDCNSVMTVLSWDPLKIQLTGGDPAETAFLQELEPGDSGRVFTHNIGFVKRAAAALLDMVLWGVPLNIVMRLAFGSGASNMLSPAYVKVLILSQFCGAAYQVGMWTFADGATLGKKILKIKIVKEDGSPLTFNIALLRYLAYIVALIPCWLGVLAIIFNDEHRGWHDKLADTKVISAEPPALNY